MVLAFESTTAHFRFPPTKLIVLRSCIGWSFLETVSDGSQVCDAEYNRWRQRHKDHTASSVEQMTRLLSNPVWERSDAISAHTAAVNL